MSKVLVNKKSNSASKTFGEELRKEDFRVTIFGSARIKKGDSLWQDIFEMAKEIGKRKWDMVTGGGPGLMEAANAGHKSGDPNHESDSIGLTIELPFEAGANKHLDLQKHFAHFSSRLDHFMVLSNAVIVTPGGIGTCLELFYTWQLTQVKHICPIPIILYGKQWHKLIDWVKDFLLKDKLINEEDLGNIFCVESHEEILTILDNLHGDYLKNPDTCMNLKKYRLSEL
jgi:uncharacterized protein (TIGR00730 family)